jgi:1-deoxy-D-xylulose-5-phosphate reductoisomerase
MTKSITILGSTGTIGQNTIELIAENREDFIVETLIAKRNSEKLAEQAKLIKPKRVVIEDESQFQPLKESLKNYDIEVLAGSQTVIDVSAEKVDLYISGAVGFCALKPTMAAIKSGANIGLANKECLVCAGDLMMDEVQSRGIKLLPIDSEHNSIFQVFDFKNLEHIEKIILTASGGPFRNFTIEQMKLVTPEMAVKHPNWNMGAKISVDSATMMNKGLEVIEAFHLFPISKSQIDVVVHPESIIHGLVQYKDGAVLAGMSSPDMKVPISYALSYPERINAKTEAVDLLKIGRLTFEAPDSEKFPALRIARAALNEGGAAPTILNASNEVAVEEFLKGNISFLDISALVERTLEKMLKEFSKISDIEECFEVDSQTRKMARDSLNKNLKIQKITA